MADTIRREFAVALTRSGGDQRTLGGCCVPYNKASTVSDDGLTVYREMFAPGAFGKQLTGNATARIALKYRHGEGLLDTVGRATQLEERDDGMWGMFRVFEGVVGDQALTLVDEGLLAGLSVSGVPMRTTRTADGTVVRERIHLTEVSLCEEPAYAEALVSVRRSRVELDLPERPSDDQLARLAKVGIVIGR
jgi:HK97 family phage prohead protease